MPNTKSKPHLHYQRVGEVGPRVLLIMGFGMRGRLWKPQVNGLKRDHQLLFYDNRGIGDSESEGTDWTMPLFARDAVRVMDAAGWDDCHVVGVSMGGMIAQHIALDFPDKVSTLTLIVTHPGGKRAVLPTGSGLKCFAEANLKTNGRIQAMQRLLYPAHFLQSVDQADLKARMAEQLGSRPQRQTVLKQLGAVVRHRVKKRLPEIRVPTLVIKAGQDILIRPSNSDVLAKLIPNAQLYVVPEAGHGLVYQAAKKD